MLQTSMHSKCTITKTNVTQTATERQFFIQRIALSVIPSVSFNWISFNFRQLLSIPMNPKSVVEGLSLSENRSRFGQDLPTEIRVSSSFTTHKYNARRLGQDTPAKYSVVYLYN